MERITGAYPGGPSKGEGPSRRSRRPRLLSLDQIEGVARSRQREGVARRRRRRLLVGFIVAMVAAGVTGFSLGLQSRQSSEEISAERRALSERDRALTRETNRILLELWKMEDLETRVLP